MPIRFFSPVVKAGRRGRGRRPPPTKKQLNALHDRMEKVFKVGFSQGIERLKAHVDPASLERMFRSADYRGMVEEMPIKDLGSYLQDAFDSLHETIGRSADLAAKALPADLSARMQTDIRNPDIRDYLGTRTGALIENVTDSTHEMVQHAVKTAFAQGITAKDVADNIRGSIGLNSRQAAAYAAFQGSDREKEAYRERLLDQRAETIARTEISAANNFGQVSVWKAGQEEGLIDTTATKVWVTDADPCPELCDDMDGVEVPVDEDFTLPDGTTVDAPPAHPRCRCLLSLNIGDSPTSGRENYRTEAEGGGNTVADGGEDDG